MGLSGRKVIVTGGTGALGSVVVSAFHQAGSLLALPSPGASESALLAAGVLTARCDLTREEDVRAFFTLAASRIGDPDILVNIAGGFAGGKFVEETSADEMDAMLRLNLRTAHLSCAAVLAGMKARGFGRIVNIAAMAALSAGPKRGSYAIAKGAVATLTEVISEECRGTGVTCNAIAPSIIRTAANEASMPNADRSRWVTPEEIAALILFLASEEARSISGNVIKVYGGVG